MSGKIYILLPVHNRKEITRRFVACLKQQTFQNFHLVLIDDGSIDGTADMVRSEISNLTVLTGNGNLWWAGSLQLGIDWLKRQEIDAQDVVLLSNDDITFDADFLQKAIQILGRQNGVLLLPKYVDEVTGQVMETGVEANLRKMSFTPAASPEKINCLPTRGLFIRISDLLIIGDFYPRLLPHYLSDYEFTIRANRKGLRLCTSSDLLITRDDAASGYRSFDGLTFFEFLKQYFSKKSVGNPIYQTVFVLLTNEFPHVIINIVKVWGVALICVMKVLSRKSGGELA
jgi:GT2 family glycosyltransferase